jgi:hypothetical protein
MGILHINENGDEAWLKLTTRPLSSRLIQGTLERQAKVLTSYGKNSN